MQNDNIMTLPDVDSVNIHVNPTLVSPNCPFDLPFYETKETLLEAEDYKAFLENAIMRFRKSRTYKHYKGYLIGLGMDRCQFLGNINTDMATIEMHHNMLTIFDIALILTEYTLKTKGMISTFDLVKLLKQEHINNRIQLIMLSLTPHQLYHNNDEFFIHPDMCFGKWWEFLEIYHIGITKEIAFKIKFYITKALEEGTSNDHDLLMLRDKIEDWSRYND